MDYLGRFSGLEGCLDVYRGQSVSLYGDGAGGTGGSSGGGCCGGGGLNLWDLKREALKTASVSARERATELEKEGLRIYDLPSGVQMHLHNDSLVGNFQLSGKRIPEFDFQLNAYEAAMADLRANRLKFPVVDTFCEPKKNWWEL